MASTVTVGRSGTRPATNLRTDRWWLQPMATFVGLTAFVAYGFWTTLTPHGYYTFDPALHRHYLSPFYSPCITARCGAGTTWRLVGWWPYSAAILMLPFPLIFRGSCYYYRKAYYRSFWLSPPACAVPEPHRRYTGESRLPLVVHNLHRYALYLIVPFPVILAWEAVKALRFESGDWGLGLGGLVLLVNAVLLGLYTASCHSCRHLCGGHLKAFSRGPVRYWMWKRVSYLNEHHMLLAWVSLVSVAVADVYVRLVASGAFHDPRLF